MPEALPGPVRAADELHAVPAGADASEVLRQEVARAVQAHPGVLRLEPTLLGTVRGLGRRNGDGQDGVALVLNGRVVDLDVNLATRADHQARASVLELQRQLRDLVTRHGFVPGEPRDQRPRGRARRLNPSSSTTTPATSGMAGVVLPQGFSQAMPSLSRSLLVFFL